MQITHLIVNCNMVLPICHGVGVFNYYHNIMIIYKQKDKTHFDNIIIRQHYINDWFLVWWLLGSVIVWVCLVGNGCGSLSCTEQPGEQGGRCHSNSHSFINVHPPPHSVGFHLMSQMTVHSPIYTSIFVYFINLLAHPAWYWFSDK